ncbi:MAG: 6,7-dimethyl-8-ribityllumazine synthase [Verrucomicrobia bacterium]|nr:6,7-dimethyl-8-ribityllumazine synthase [Verrucomicrobiota bacterium]
MLKKLRTTKTRADGARFAIVASTYNRRYVDGMVRAAVAELKRARAADVKVVRVPGAFEIPVVAAALARGNASRHDAVICLGVILRGATHHAQTICDAITQSLANIAVATGVPVIHEVLMVENEAQAKERCLVAKHNRGTEAAQTAVEMVRVMREL